MLDVGAHRGETLAVALEPKWGFERIYSFEPAPQCWPRLEAIADERTTILPFGLWTQDAELMLHDPGTVGASLMEGKRLTTSTAVVSVRDAARWFQENISCADEVVMKVNCEGAECDLLEHLLNHGQLHKVSALLVHFDVRKIPSMRHREAETRALLDAARIPYRPAEAIFFGRNISEKTANWLAWHQSTGVRRLRYSLARRMEFAVRTRVYGYRHRRRPTDGG